jgi:hypothetical protein
MASVQDFVSVLRNSQPQVHIWHNQTDNFAAHSALGFYYEAIGEQIDELVESIQGCYPRITGYKPIQKYTDWVSTDACQEYFKLLYEYLEAERSGLPQNSFIQNIVDEIVQTVANARYKLSLK